MRADSGVELSDAVKLLDALAHAAEKMPHGASVYVCVTEAQLWQDLVELVPSGASTPKSIPDIITCDTGKRIGFKTDPNSRVVTAHRLSPFARK